MASEDPNDLLDCFMSAIAETETTTVKTLKPVTELNEDTEFLGKISNYDLGLVDKPKTSPKTSKDKTKNSAIHTGETDSSDDEDQRNFELRKYNNSGKDIKNLINDSTSTTSTSFSARENTWKTKPKPQTTTITKPTTSEVTSVYTDPIFGLRIVNPLISSAVLQDRMQGRTAISFGRIKTHSQSVKPDQDWVFAGVLVSKLVKTSQKGTQYSIWTISDLHGDLKTIGLFLFSGAHKALWKSNVGTVLGVLNPGVLDQKEGSKDQATLSVDNAQKVMILGHSKDLGTCKSTKKSGEPCTSFVNKTNCDFCVYHVKQEYQKCSKRQELQSSFAGRGLDALRNKVLGKNEVFYAGKSFMATKNKKLQKQDDSRLNLLQNRYNSTISTNSTVTNSDLLVKKGLASRLDMNRNQRKKDLQLLKKLCGNSGKIEETANEKARNEAIEVIKNLKAKNEVTKGVTTVKSAQFNQKYDLFGNIEGKRDFEGKLSAEVTLAESKSTALSVIAKLKAKKSQNSQEINGKIVGNSPEVISKNKSLVIEEKEEKSIKSIEKENDLMDSLLDDDVDLNYDELDDIREEKQKKVVSINILTEKIDNIVKTNLKIDNIGERDSEINVKSKLTELSKKSAKIDTTGENYKKSDTDLCDNLDLGSLKVSKSVNGSPEGFSKSNLVSSSPRNTLKSNAGEITSKNTSNPNLDVSTIENSSKLDLIASTSGEIEKSKNLDSSSSKNVVKTKNLDNNSMDETKNAVDAIKTTSKLDIDSSLSKEALKSPSSKNNSHSTEHIENLGKNTENYVKKPSDESKNLSNSIKTTSDCTQSTSKLAKSTVTSKSNLDSSSSKNTLNSTKSTTNSSKNTQKSSRNTVNSTNSTKNTQNSSKNTLNSPSSTKNSQTSTKNTQNSTKHTLNSSNSQNSSTNSKNPSNTPKLTKNNLAFDIPLLSGLGNKSIDLNSPISRRHVDRAKLNALKYIQRNGPIAKPGPSDRKRKLDALKSPENEDTKRLKVIQKNEFFSEKFKKMMAATSKHSNLVTAHDNLEQDKYFSKLEMKEKMEDKLQKTFKIDCKAVHCTVCKYTSFSASESCRKDRHKLRVFDAIKRFFKCGSCGKRTVCLTVFPVEGCTQCGGVKWEKCGMIGEKVVKSVGEGLCIRGVEEKNIGGGVWGGNINLLVPEEGT